MPGSLGLGSVRESLQIREDSEERRGRRFADPQSTQGNAWEEEYLSLFLHRPDYLHGGKSIINTMFKTLQILSIFIINIACFDHLLEGGTSIKVSEEDFNSRKKLHPKILLMIWDNTREEVVSDLMKWKKIASSLPQDILPLHFERNEHNRMTERILPKAFPAYIFVEDEHFAYEFVSINYEIDEIIEFSTEGYKQFPKEHIPHKYDPKKKFKKAWPKLLALFTFIFLTIFSLCCCFKHKNRIDDEEDQKLSRHYKVE